MDYVFQSEAGISTETAVWIISSLIDLQEDYRYAVKKSFIDQILKYLK